MGLFDRIKYKMEFEKFKKEVEKNGRTFTNTESYFVDKEECIMCGSCMALCPADAITEDENGYPQIDSAECLCCGTCADGCVIEAIYLRDIEN